MKLAYFDCFSGISGDMVLGALVDLGVPVDWLSEQIRRLPLPGVSLKAESVSKYHIAATRVHVEIGDTDAERSWADIRSLLEGSKLPEPVRRKSLAVFARLAEVEAGIHRSPVDEVHFHEIGGADALADVVGSVAGLDYLGVDEIVCSPLPLARGIGNARHGPIPLPAPATVGLLEGVPVHGDNSVAELVTPTGAALMAVLADGFGPLPSIRLGRVGYGAGSAELADRPNLMRVFFGNTAPEADRGTTESVAVLEAAVDDMNPELFGFLMERLFAEGALDASWMPAQMKKNRPGTKVEVVCRPEDKERLVTLLLTESSSTGVRFQTVRRRILPRTRVSVPTEYGPIDAKEIRLPDGTFRRTPEYEACRKISEKKGVALWRIYEAVVSAGGGPGTGRTGGADPDSV